MVSYTLSFTPFKHLVTAVTPLIVSAPSTPTTESFNFSQVIPSFVNVYEIDIITTNTAVTGYTGVVTYHKKGGKTKSVTVNFVQFATGSFYYEFYFPCLDADHNIDIVVTQIL